MTSYRIVVEVQAEDIDTAMARQGEIAGAFPKANQAKVTDLRYADTVWMTVLTGEDAPKNRKRARAQEKRRLNGDEPTGFSS